MKILVTGGTGFIGSHLTGSLVASGHDVTVLTRSAARARRRVPDTVTLVESLDAIVEDTVFDAVVNLAGAPIFGGRWTDRRKRNLVQSRVGLTEALGLWMHRLHQAPDVFVSGSAIGFYGDAGDLTLTESSPAARMDFSYRLCDAWEQSARKATPAATRLCVLRTGVVLGADGGMLARLLPVYRLGLGARLGSGQQWLSWIHIDDMVAVLRFCIERDRARGVFNAVAPGAVTQEIFHRTLARVCRRPAPLVAPGLLLKSALGEMSTMLLGGQHVVPEHLLNAGFTFRYPDINVALQQLAA